MKIISICQKVFIARGIEMKTIIKKLTRKLMKFLNIPIKKTWWYKQNYSDAAKMKNWYTFNLDLAVLGSSAVKYGLDFSSFEINAANWAMSPQNISSDFAILKNYHSYIKENGLLLFMLCPFSGMVIDVLDKRFYDRYHYFLHPILVKHFSEQTLKKIRRIIDYPLLGMPKASIKAMIKMLLGKDEPKYPAKIDAQNRIDNWKKEFSIENFTDPLSEKNLKAIEFNTSMLCEMAEFCKERSLKPIFGIMPTTKILKNHIPMDFMQTAFYSMVEKIKDCTGALFLDFYRSSEFESEDLYLDSFLMNEKGRKLFTEKILKEVFL